MLVMTSRVHQGMCSSDGRQGESTRASAIAKPGGENGRSTERRLRSFGSRAQRGRRGRVVGTPAGLRTATERRSITCCGSRRCGRAAGPLGDGSSKADSVHPRPRPPHDNVLVVTQRTQSRWLRSSISITSVLTPPQDLLFGATRPRPTGGWWRSETKPRRLWSRARLITMERRYAADPVVGDPCQAAAEPDERLLDEVLRGRLVVDVEAGQGRSEEPPR